MATPRQNPQFDPQRIVQPTASPIDTYFQPMLAQPEQPKILQVAAALADISPQLNRLSSDAMAANIAAQKEYGQYEALTERDPDVARRRATEAIEGSGGIAPWRYQSYLEAYGQRLVRDKYRNALYKNLDDLSNPYNADGTIRAPTYVGEQMTKLYDEAQIPQDSYFMNKGAAAARAEADNSFYERLMGARRQRVLQSSKDAFADGIQFNIDINPDVEKLFEPGGSLETLAKVYYENGGQDGDDVMTQAILNASQAAAAQGNYDRAEGLLRRSIDGPVGSRPIGKRHQPRFVEALEIIERKAQDAELNDLRNFEGRTQLAQSIVDDAVLLKIQKSAPATGQMILTQAEINDLVSKEISALPSNVSDDIKLRVQARAANAARVNIDAYNRSIGEPKKDTRTTNMALDMAYQQSQTMPPAEYSAYISGMLDQDQITWPQAQQLREQNKAFFSQSDVDRQHTATLLSSISGQNWTGLDPKQIAVDGQSKLNSLGNEASTRVLTAHKAKINSLEFRKSYPDDTQRSLAQNQVLDELVAKEKADLLVKHKDLIAQYDLSASYEANVSAFAKTEIPTFVGFVLTDLGFEEGLESSRLGARLGQYLDAELKKEWASLSAEAGAPPLSLSDRRQKWFEAVENVKDRFIDTVQNNPQLLNLSPTLSTSLKNKQAEKSGSMGTGELQVARGTVSSVTDVSRSISTDNPSKSVIRGSSVPWFGDKNTVTPVFESESALFDTASRASKTYRSIILATENGSFTPEMQQQHNIDKAAMNVEAERYISDFTSTTIRTVSPYSPWRPEGWANGRWRSLPNDRDVPLFIFRDDGVYVAVRGFSAVEPTRSGDIVDNKVVYTPQTDLNARYWAAKAVTGYSKEEVTSGRTAEGVRITPAQLDPREFLLFKSPEEFSTALAEYTTTSGKSGFIAELLPRTGVTYEVFRATQLKLLGMRKPLVGTPQAQ